MPDVTRDKGVWAKTCSAARKCINVLRYGDTYRNGNFHVTEEKMRAEKEADLRHVLIDKTSTIEEALPGHLMIILSGMPGVGKKTAVRMLLQKHPEVNAVFCDVEELIDKSVLDRRKEGTVNWYLIRNAEDRLCGDLKGELLQFIRHMQREDRIFLAVNGIVPSSLLELVWNGMAVVILPETFWFSEGEVYRYLKLCRSRLDCREVFRITGGWAGCAAMLVRLERQLGEGWSARELASRYEVRRYIRTQIVAVLTERERKVLTERVPFPRLSEELAVLLWTEWDKETEDSLLVRGAMRFVPGQKCWHVHPALRAGIDRSWDGSVLLRAVEWYEKNGYVQDALECTAQMHDIEAYRDCLARNYDRVSFLAYDKVWEEKDLEMPEFFYLEWMGCCLRQDFARMEELRPKMERMPAEIFLNAAYADSRISAQQWMELLREKTEKGKPVRLYYTIGETVSCLSGIRDLSDLFACGGRKREEYRRLWEERLTPDCRQFYELAQQEYEIQTGVETKNGKEWAKVIRPYDERTPWQIRLVLLYLAYLAEDDFPSGAVLRKYMDGLARSLEKEEAEVCRWNARALHFLAEAKRGEKEKLISWVRETDGEIGNDMGKTCFYMAAEVKVNLYLGNEGRAEELLAVLIPYFAQNASWRWLAESLFQLALVEYEKGREGEAFQLLSRSFEISGPRRYTRMYTGYGAKGAALLKDFQKIADDHRAAYREMPEGGERRLNWIVREAGCRQRAFPDLEKEGRELYRAERLTATEHMVLEYLAEGYSNRKISESMHIKLSTVKSHIYNIYRKLGASTRIQAVRRAREYGIL